MYARFPMGVARLSLYAAYPYRLFCFCCIRYSMRASHSPLMYAKWVLSMACAPSISHRIPVREQFLTGSTESTGYKTGEVVQPNSWSTELTLSARLWPWSGLSSILLHPVNPVKNSFPFVRPETHEQFLTGSTESTGYKREK